jgi:alanine dehydrogenase
MRIGVPKEIKNHEYRVGLVPASVAELAHHGHRVTVEKGAGAGIGIVDADYVAAGATIADDGAAIFAERRADREGEGAAGRRAQDAAQGPDPVHLPAPGARPPQTLDLMKSGATCIAYETVTSPQGGLPLLTPMSEVAGRLAPQVGAHALEKAQGGRGVLLGGVPGVPPAEGVMLGGGVSGTHAATIAIGMGAHVTVLDRSLPRAEAAWRCSSATACRRYSDPRRDRCACCRAPTW